MKKKLEEIVKILKDNNKTVSIMESCTGGAIVNSITNISSASQVLKFSVVTYSNSFKIKMGVSYETIDKYTVYSKETARDMAKSITNFALSNYGIGVTGKLGKRDFYNDCGVDNQVFICVYDSDNDVYFDFDVFVNSEDRRDDKLEVLSVVIDKFLGYLKGIFYNY